MTTNDSDDHALRELIREEIQATGPLTFARFMERALLDPAHGYYTQHPAVGRHGDFVTAPELHAAFGACLARQAAEIWRALGQPAPFSIVEWGAGTGALARDLLTTATTLDPGLAPALDYALREVSPALIARQRQTLAAADQPARWTAAAAPARGLVLANEVLDALPVHRVTLRDGQLCELLVDWHNDALVEIAAPPSTPALAAYLAEGQIQLEEGQIAEINLAAVDWLADVAAGLAEGAIIIIDYGDTTAELYSRRRFRGTLLCYYQQTFNEEPFARIGRQDMTAHVDFGALMRQAARSGLTVAGLTTQGAFLAGLGLGELLIDLNQRLPAIEYIRQRELISSLIRPDRLGRFKVLILTRNLPADLTLAGLSVRL